MTIDSSYLRKVLKKSIFVATTTFATMFNTTAVAKRSADTGLMLPPPPPPKRIKRPAKVLDEDKYTAALSHIIARDFFPGLLESETQQDYLDALETGDRVWINEAGQRVREAMTPARQRGRRGVSMTPRRGFVEGGETPKSFRGDTPIRTTLSESGDEEREEVEGQEEKIDLQLSLSAFQAKYTSEDNESFNKVLDKQNTTRAAKYQWLHNNNKLPSKQQLLQASVNERKLLTASNSSSTQALSLRPSQDQNDRPASISAPPSTLLKTAQGPRNGFMFTPTDLTESQPHLLTLADQAQSRSLAGPRSVTYAATRLPTSLHQESSLDDNDDTASLSLTAIDAAIRGQPRRRDLGSMAGTAVSGNETPRVNGYAFVDAEPTPSEMGHATSPPSDNDDLLQKMIESASERSTGPNPFTINSASAREDLHHRLVDKTLASKRKSSSRLDYLKGDGTGRTPTPKFASSPRLASTSTGGSKPVGRKTALGGLTPAARMLYNKLDGNKTPVGGGGAFDARREGGSSGQKGAWTPTPLRRKT